MENSTNPLDDLENIAPNEQSNVAFNYAEVKDKIGKFASVEGSATRCQAITTNRGQCPNEQSYLPDGQRTQYCRMHGGHIQQNQAEREHTSNYKLTIWQARLQRLASNTNIKGLRDEVAILRMTMEETLEQCQTPNDLLMRAPQISDLAMRIERLVVSCHKLENAMGGLLDKTKVLSFGQQVVEAITRHVDDGSKLSAISNEIMLALELTIRGSEDTDG